MQPIVLKIANSDGFADYTDGLVPESEDLIIRERVSSYDVLGSPTEPLLEAALNHISGGGSAKGPSKNGPLLETVLDNNTAKEQRMYIDFPRVAIKEIN